MPSRPACHVSEVWLINRNDVSLGCRVRSPGANDPDGRSLDVIVGKDSGIVVVPSLYGVSANAPFELGLQVGDSLVWLADRSFVFEPDAAGWCLEIRGEDVVSSTSIDEEDLLARGDDHWLARFILAQGGR